LIDVIPTEKHTTSLIQLSYKSAWVEYANNFSVNQAVNVVVTNDWRLRLRSRLRPLNQNEPADQQILFDWSKDANANADAIFNR